MAVDTYYFDGSVNTSSDSVTNFANAYDGSTSTFATLNTPDVSELYIHGTNAPNSGGDITLVRARIYGSTGFWGNWTTLTAPTGGFTWNYLRTRLAVYLFADGLGFVRGEYFDEDDYDPFNSIHVVSIPNIYRVEIEVTSEDSSEEITNTIDSTVKVTIEKTNTTDNLVKQANIEETATTDTFSTNRNTLESTIDNFVKAPETATATTDMLSIGQGSASATIDLPVTNQNIKTATTDVYISGEYPEELKVVIGGVQQTTKILFPTFQVTDHINQQVDTATFKTRDYKPALGEEVLASFNGSPIFGGIVISVTTEQKAQTQTHTVKCKDFSHLLGRKLVLKRYEDMTLGAIITDLLTEYATDFTDDFVDCDILIGTIAFNRITVMEAIQRMAELVNYSWYVDYEKNIHFFALNQEPALFNLTEKGGNHIWDSLKIKDDFSQIRNQVYVVGGEFEASERTESYIADGTQEQFPLAYKFATKPTVFMNSVEQTVGIDGIDNEDNFDCFWNFSAKYIRFGFGSPPTATHEVEITGVPLLPVIVKITNPQSVLQHGLYEFKIEDSTIYSKNGAVERAKVELDAYKNSISEGEFATYRGGLKSGQIINIDVNGISGDYIIQRCDFRARAQTQGEWNVQIATTRTLGIIQFLQGMLRTKTRVDDGEVLLNLEQASDDVEISDTLTAPSRVTAPPYLWADATDTDDEGKWNFFTWS